MYLFSYCAYEDSPVGFQLGVVKYDFESNILEEIQKIKEDDILEKDNKDIKIKNYFFFLIDSFFNTGKISKVYGKFPLLEKEEYIYLLKNFEEKKDDKDFYLNIAFQTDKKEEYLKIKKYFNKLEEKEYFGVLSKIIDIDNRNKDLGISINSDEFKKIISNILYEEIDNSEKIENKIYIEVKENIKNAIEKSDQNYKDRITSEIKSGCNLGLLNKNIENEKDKVDIILDKKRKLYQLQKKISVNPLIIGVILIIILIILIVH